MTGPELTVSKLFYLRPYGDGVGPKGKIPFHISTSDGTGRSRAEAPLEDGRLVVSVDGPGRAVKLKTQGSRCSGDEVSVTCKLGAAYDNWLDLGRVWPVAAAGAEAGSRAKLRYRYTMADGTVLKAVTRVVVGEPVLEVSAPRTLSGALPGMEIDIPVTVRNTGEVTAEGLGFGLDVPGRNGSTIVGEAGNCRYQAGDARHTAVCRLPGLRLRPGERVTLAPALRIRAPETVLVSRFHQQAWPLDLGPPKDSNWPTDGEAGDGPALTRVAAPAHESLFHAEGDAWTEVELAASADFEAIGAEIRGVPDSEHKVSVGVRNNGPGATAPAGLKFTLPPGSTALEQPMTAIDVAAYEPSCEHDGMTFTCPVTELGPGKSQMFEFTLRLGGDSTGLVDVGRSRWDDKPDNDAAVVTVSP
ncbi:hypothetical protein [Streptomyces sp. AS58]|uniref:hypothetical protein n=1 Tax=Streptomyces sp. AS58 TaxID=1519489 RepID=UPI0006AFFD5B|nr:hypothetical protein [Streptomyces sp. AS58]